MPVLLGLIASFVCLCLIDYFVGSPILTIIKEGAARTDKPTAKYEEVLKELYDELSTNYQTLRWVGSVMSSAVFTSPRFGQVEFLHLSIVSGPIGVRIQNTGLHAAIPSTGNDLFPILKNLSKAREGLAENYSTHDGYNYLISPEILNQNLEDYAFVHFTNLRKKQPTEGCFLALNLMFDLIPHRFSIQGNDVVIAAQKEHAEKLTALKLKLC